MDEQGNVARSRPFTAYTLTQLPGKTVKLKIKLADENCQAGVTLGSKSREAGSAVWEEALKTSVAIAMEITKILVPSEWWMNGSAPFTQAARKARTKPNEHSNFSSE